MTFCAGENVLLSGLSNMAATNLPHMAIEQWNYG